MRLLCIFAATLALSLAEIDNKIYDDLLAMETMELKKTARSTDLNPSPSVYNSFVPPTGNWNHQQYVPPTWNPPQNTWNQPQNTWAPPANILPTVPSNYVPPVNYVPNVTPGPVQSDYVPPQNNYPQWSTPSYHSTTTTPVSVIKNEQYQWDNGAYKYEYQIADGTHVGEEGYFTDPKGSDESLVKKGWYSYQGADGKTYTVTYWADKTGYHAYGDHLPVPPPVPAAIQAALDKEEAEKNKPAVQPQPQPQPQNPTYYPPQQTYYPNQQNQYPNQQNQYPNQQTQYPNQQNQYPNQQTQYPNQQTYYPQQGYGK